MPDEPEGSEVGRDLPSEVMTQLCRHLDSLEAMGAIEIRTGVELIQNMWPQPKVLMFPAGFDPSLSDVQLTWVQAAWDAADQARSGRP